MKVTHTAAAILLQMEGADFLRPDGTEKEQVETTEACVSVVCHAARGLRCPKPVRVQIPPQYRALPLRKERVNVWSEPEGTGPAYATYGDVPVIPKTEVWGHRCPHGADIVFITGPNGSGKTRRLRETEPEEVRRHGPVEDLFPLLSLFRLRPGWKERLQAGQPGGSTEEGLLEFAKQVNSGRRLVVLDDIVERLDKHNQAVMAMYWRALAFSEDLDQRRQVYVSLNEETCETLYSLMLPPPGSRFEILELSLEEEVPTRYTATEGKEVSQADLQAKCEEILHLLRTTGGFPH